MGDATEAGLSRRPFADRVCLVTGGSRGIGFAIARQVVSDGGRVVLTGRDQWSLSKAVAELGGTSIAASAAGDTADARHREAAVAAAVSQFGRIDHLVNNVGISREHGPLQDADLTLFRETIETNLVATLAWSQLVWHAGMGQHGGSIVNVSSLSGLIVFREQNAYTVTKAAVLQLTRQLALDMAPSVRVNAVAPAVTRTEAGREHWEHNEAALAAQYPLGRIAEPRDIADAVCFLLSDRASWITGHTLVADGGHMLYRALSRLTVDRREFHVLQGRHQGPHTKRPRGRRPVDTATRRDHFPRRCRYDHFAQLAFAIAGAGGSSRPRRGDGGAVPRAAASGPTGGW